jgi:hypothetical protein
MISSALVSLFRATRFTCQGGMAPSGIEASREEAVYGLEGFSDSTNVVRKANSRGPATHLPRWNGPGWKLWGKSCFKKMGIPYANMDPIVLSDVTALKATSLLSEKRAKQNASPAETQTATMGVLEVGCVQWRKPLKGMALSRVMAKSWKRGVWGLGSLGKRVEGFFLREE